MDIRKLYKERFLHDEIKRKNEIWRVLCNSFFQKFIAYNHIVLDVGAGYCEFINNIRCSVKYAADPNPDTAKYASPEVKVFTAFSTDLIFLANNSVDVVFISNLLEHMKSKDDVIKTLAEAYRVLKPGQNIMILQPNIRYLYKEYWDFFDHHIPLSDRSLVEALQLANFQVEIVIPKFIPYTTKSRIPKNSALIKMYLKIPLLWKIFGKQTFVMAKKI